MMTALKEVSFLDGDKTYGEPCSVEFSVMDMINLNQIVYLS